MSHFTQSGNRRSNRIAGNPPNTATSYTSPTVQNDNTIFSPFNDTQASNDGVSYGTSSSSHSNNSNNNINQTQSNIGFLQQSSQSSSDTSTTTPVHRGQQSHQNTTLLAMNTENTANNSANATQRSNQQSEHFQPQMPPQPTNPTVIFNNQQQQHLQHQPIMTSSYQNHQTFNPRWNQQPPPQQFQPVQQYGHQQQPPPLPQFNPSELTLSRISQLEQRMDKIESSQNNIATEMKNNHTTIMQLLQQAISNKSSANNQEQSLNHTPPTNVNNGDVDLLNINSVATNNTTQVNNHGQQNQPTISQYFHPTNPPMNVVDLTRESQDSSEKDNNNITQHTTTSIQQNQPSNSNNQQPIIVRIEGKKDSRLGFRPFKPKKEDYEVWRDTCFSKISTHDAYPTSTIEHADGSITLNPDMTNKESRLIVQATLDNLEDSTQFTMGENILKIQATALWDMLDAYYIKHKNPQVKGLHKSYSKLIKQWTDFERRKNETIDQYTLRFKQIVKMITEEENIPLKLDHQMIIMEYLTKMNEKAIRENIMMDFNKYKAEWCDGKEIFDVQLLAKAYIEQAKYYVPRYGDTTEPPTEVVPPPAPAPVPPPAPAPAPPPPSSSSNNRTKNKEQPPAAPTGFDYDRLKSTLEKVQDKTAYLETCYNQNNSRFAKREFKQACTKANCWEEWKTVAKKFNVPVPGETTAAAAAAARRVAAAANQEPPAWMNTFQNTVQNQLTNFASQLQSIQQNHQPSATTGQPSGQNDAWTTVGSNGKAVKFSAETKAGVDNTNNINNSTVNN